MPLEATSERFGDWSTSSRLSNIFALLSLLVIYYVYTVVYGLYFGPLSHIPCRRLAAATHFYAFYHDVIRGGKYIWEIEQMHKQHGPIIRISPDEVHVNDLEFIDQIYAGSGKRREKGQLTINGLGRSPTAIGTQSHDLHKSRRAALNPFFSAQRIRRLEPMAQEVLEHIFQRMEQHRANKTPVNMSALYRAATYDLISDYALGQSVVCFGREDLNQPYFDSYHGMVCTWYIGCYFPWLGMCTRLLPTSVVDTLVPMAKHFIALIAGLMNKIDYIRSSGNSEEARTIMHGLLQSDLPESEKSPARLAEEAAVLISAGTDSSANTLSTITYHLLANPDKLRLLRAELVAAIPAGQLPTLAQIESLPYLSATIQEGLRITPAVSSRQQRVAPDETLTYTSPTNGKSYAIPARTCMSMTAPLLARLESVYPSPQEFRPERFLEHPKLKGYNMTFSHGTRICLGMNLAYQEMYMILAGLFARYEGWNGKEGLELWWTTREDVDIVRDLVTENTRDGSVGVRVLIH